MNMENKILLKRLYIKDLIPKIELSVKMVAKPVIYIRTD